MKQLSPFAMAAADRLAMAVIELVESGELDARSQAADHALNYASIRFGDSNPIGALKATVQMYEKKSPPQNE